ncbi:MAG: hypothetical protein ACYCSS_12905, partial [Sulfuriferula sp.]
MKKTTGIGVIIVTSLFATNALAAAGDAPGNMPGYMPGDIIARARVVNMDFDSSSSPLTGITATNKTIPEVDVSYFFTSHIAAELILT